MALLTVSMESALTEAGISVLTASVFHGLAANLASARAEAKGYRTVHLKIKAKGYHRNLALACKRGIVIVRAEFGGKQSHEIEPRT